MVVVVCECHLSVYKTIYHCQNYTRYSKCTTFSVLHRYRHRHLHQTRANPGYFEACILLSQGPNAKTRGMPSDQHKCAYAHTDIHIAYSVVTKYVLQLCIKCGLAKSCPGTHTALQAPMGTDQDLSCPTWLMTAIMGYDSHRELVRYNFVHWGSHD